MGIAPTQHFRFIIFRGTLLNYDRLPFPMLAVIEILDGVLDRKFLYPARKKFNSESPLGISRIITSGGGRVQNASDRPY